MEFIYFLIAIFSTTVGAMSGMGGGIIIKPLMDAISGQNVATINFMSCCAVFAMAVSSVYRGRKDELDINYRISSWLACGACVGGILGKLIFDLFQTDIALLQSIILLVLNLLIYFFLKIQDTVQSKQYEKNSQSFIIGASLGAISSFLGIGGGPINVVVLRYFYSTSPKITLKRSLFVILFSQLSSIITSFYYGLPENLNYFGIFLMMIGGVCGAILGGKLSKKLNNSQIDSFFKDVLVGILILNAFNVGRLL